MDIGERIRTIRKKKGIKQKDLAKTIGLTTNGLQKIEYGEVIPKRLTVHKIAKALEVSDIDLDDNLKEMVERWNENNVSAIAEEAVIFSNLPPYTIDDIEIFRNFLSLDPEGQEKASEYIDFLMQKHRKE